MIAPEPTRVIQRDRHRTYPIVARGKGVYLHDDAGQRYLDGPGGSSAVTAMGHGVAEVRRRGGSFVGGRTASGNPLSCAVGAAVLRRYVRDHDLVRNAAQVGASFLDRLRELTDRQPVIGDVRGIGLLLGVELVRDRATKEPFPPAWQIGHRVGAATIERDLVSYPRTGTVDGALDDHLLYAPPLSITRAQLVDLGAILDDSLTAVAAEIGLTAGVAQGRGRT